MHIRNQLLFAVAFALATAGCYTQDAAKDRVKALKVAFITERLHLTPKEAQRFWPIYNQHEEALRVLRKKTRTVLNIQPKALENMTYADTSALLDEVLALQKQRHEAGQSFITKVSKTISPKKTLLLLEAEKAFKKQLLLQYRERGGSR